MIDSSRKKLVPKADVVLLLQRLLSLLKSRDPAGWCKHMYACDYLGTGNGSGTG